jgi:molybdopterin converting factor small subunit
MPRLHVYPPYRASVGQDELALDLPAGTTVRQMLEVLAERYPAFEEFARARSDEFLWGQLIVHVNNDIAGLKSTLQPDDVIDLLPPIAGGAVEPASRSDAGPFSGRRGFRAGRGGSGTRRRRGRRAPPGRT